MAAQEVSFDCLILVEYSSFPYLVLYNSTFDCLLELGLTEAAKYINGSLKDMIESNNNSFTIFAPPNEILSQTNIGSLTPSQIDAIVKSHIVMQELHSPMLYDGVKKMTLSSGRFIHVSQNYESFETYQVSKYCPVKVL